MGTTMAQTGLIEQLGLAWILSGLLLIPYLCWGVYLLRLRFFTRADFGVTLEALTLVGLLIFYYIEFKFLHMWLSRSPLKMIFAVMGLGMSGLALYGHLMISLVSHLLVDAVMPSGGPTDHEPRYGAAEALEEQGDYEGAVREYVAIAGMFPKASRAALRAADNLAKLGRMAEAVTWFERGLKCITTAEESLPVLNRVVEVYSRDLDRPEAAARALEDYVRKYPQGIYTDSVRQRLARMRAPVHEPTTVTLDDGPTYLPEV